MKRLLDKIPSSASMEIIEIWSAADFACDVNMTDGFSRRLLYTPLFDPRAGPSYMWGDHARDVTSFVLHYLPLVPTQALSARLERRDDPARRSNIVAAGHSYTAAATLQAELERARCEGPDGPGLFDALLLVDPMVRVRRSIVRNSQSTKGLISLDHRPGIGLRKGRQPIAHVPHQRGHEAAGHL